MATVNITVEEKVIPTYSFKWIGDQEYCETENIVINEFDFLVTRFLWDFPTGGRDLDIQVQYELNDTPSVDGKYVGYGASSITVPEATTPETEGYLWWALDDTNTSGQPKGIEAVLVNIKKFKNNFPQSPNIIKVGLYAVWYGTVGTGEFTFEVKTYKGGTMSKIGTDLTNSGGILVSNDTRTLNTLVNNQLHTPANSYKVGTLEYNKTTDKAILILN